GRDFDDIEKSCWPVGQLFIGDDNDVLERKIKNSLPKGVSLKKFMQTNFVGNTSKFLQHIHPYLHLGVTHFMLYFGDLPDMKGMKLFAEKVINKKIN
ncbi:hypothetical protein KJN74_06010, partial [Candidatus Bathyarchaeota archaeon]|nr:hypothetical protein [Candidatus Bathyarchaeota archaeon]